MDKIKLLQDYVPSSSLSVLKNWFEPFPFTLKITKKRNTKLGDFRVKHYSKQHQITVNSNLNQYAFLITLTHEFAHLLVYEKNKRRVLPHGKEWKMQFSELLQELISHNIFPEDIKCVLINHAQNPAASSVRDIALTKALNRYNEDVDTKYLHELPKGAIFSLDNKKQFIKGDKRRTRYLCTNVKTKKQYLVHGVAEVYHENC